MALKTVGVSPPSPTLYSLCACGGVFGGHLRKCVRCVKQTHEPCGAKVQHKFHCDIFVCAWPINVL